MLQNQSERDKRTASQKDTVRRELVEIHHQWMCSNCGFQFYNLGFVLDGMTLKEIVLHMKKMREQAFAKHSCSLQ
jgi:ribosomal protein L37AE/L43A